MANKNLWSRICEALDGSKRKEKAEAKAKAEAEARAQSEALAKEIAETKEKYQKVQALLDAVRAYDVKAAHALLEGGCDVNYVLSSARMYTVDMDVCYTSEEYTPIECSHEPMTSLLRAYGGMTYAELKEAKKRQESEEERKWREESEAYYREQKRQKRLKQKQAKREVDAILAEKASRQ